MPQLAASHQRQLQSLLALLRQIRVSYALFHVKRLNPVAPTGSRLPAPARACARGSV